MVAQDWRDWYEERAAIREYDGGFRRFEAERLAREDVKRMEAQQGCPDER